jgi:hypothetical protein
VRPRADNIVLIKPQSLALECKGWTCCRDGETLKRKGSLVTWTRPWTRSANSPRRRRRDRSRIRMKASYTDEQSELVVVNLINNVVDTLCGAAMWLSNVQILKQIRE